MADGPKSPTRVIGIDPGLNITGYGIVVCCPDEVKLLEAGVIRMPRNEGENLPERLESLFVELRQSNRGIRPADDVPGGSLQPCELPSNCHPDGACSRGDLPGGATGRNPGAEFFSQAREAVRNGQWQCLQAPGAARGAELFLAASRPLPAGRSRRAGRSTVLRE